VRIMAETFSEVMSFYAQKPVGWRKVVAFFRWIAHLRPCYGCGRLTGGRAIRAGGGKKPCCFDCGCSG